MSGTPHRSRGSRRSRGSAGGVSAGAGCCARCCGAEPLCDGTTLLVENAAPSKGRGGGSASCYPAAGMDGGPLWGPGGSQHQKLLEQLLEEVRSMHAANLRMEVTLDALGGRLSEVSSRHDHLEESRQVMKLAAYDSRAAGAHEVGAGALCAHGADGAVGALCVREEERASTIAGSTLAPTEGGATRTVSVSSLTSASVNDGARASEGAADSAAAASPYFLAEEHGCHECAGGGRFTGVAQKGASRSGGLVATTSAEGDRSPTSPPFTEISGKTPGRLTRQLTFLREAHKKLCKREPPREGPLAEFIVDWRAMLMVLLVMVAEFLFITVTMNSLAQGDNLSSEPWFVWAELSFLAFYSVELSLRLLVHRWYFFVNAEMASNWLDSALVVGSLVVLLDLPGGQHTFLRSLHSALRTARLLRVLRIICAVPKLRRILNAVVAAIESLFWSLAFLSIVLFAFSIVFVQGTSEYLSQQATPEHFFQVQEDDSLRRRFSSVSEAMLTLYMACTGGEDWAPVYEDCDKTGSFYGVVFLLFNVIIQVAVLNIITSQFVEHAMKASEKDRDQRALEQLKEHRDQAIRIEELVKEIDANNSGTISYNEFKKCFTEPKVSTEFRELGLDFHHMDSFFRMLAATDKSGNNMEVPVRAFVRGCMHMRGAATSIDMQTVLFSVEQLQRQVVELTKQGAYTSAAVADGGSSASLGGRPMSSARH